MICTGYAKTDTKHKCDKCNYYLASHKNYTNLGKVLMCHGVCVFTNKYKQRTDSCKKFEVKIYEN